MRGMLESVAQRSAWGQRSLSQTRPIIAFPGLAERDLAAMGIPSQAQSIAACSLLTGRESIADLRFHVVFNLFKSAAICHGIPGRVARGTAVSDRARGHAAAVEQIAGLGWSYTRSQPA
jgi:hypothetical protein